MFGINGFHVSASGAIHGHNGPLVLYWYKVRFCLVDLSASQNTVGPLVTSGNFDGGPINKQ